MTHDHDHDHPHHPPYLNADGSLHIARWAGEDELDVEGGDGPVQMVNTEATAWPLVTAHRLGVDRISVPAGKGFPPHTHPGDHLLFVIKGRGTITMDGVIYPTSPGDVFFVPGHHPHAVGAIDEHHLLAVGAPHRMPDDPSRMALVEYHAIATELGVVRCGVCGVSARLHQLAEAGCTHAPMMA